MLASMNFSERCKADLFLNLHLYYLSYSNNVLHLSMKLICKRQIPRQNKTLTAS